MLVKDALAQLQKLVESGKGEEHCLPPVLPKAEAAARVKNEKKLTQFRMETGSDKIYSRLNAAKDRAIRIIENKTVALEILTELWERPTENELRALADGEH